ncbi:MAG: hypothetical protein D4R73_12145 [Deltaproteobacteria bacterium]|nr:MAG: hypothetical protein D4R73_12145 [Deltaproteobacteria bacterium]
MAKRFDVIFAACLVLLMGCAAATRVIDYSEMKTDVAMSESIFLSPTDAAKTIYVQVRNTSTNQAITEGFESVIISSLKGRGYKVVEKPSQATYILQANIRYLGEWKEGMDFGDTLTGASVGALAGLGLTSPGGRYAGNVAAGGLIGGALGFVADVATRVKTQVIAVDFQITERLAGSDDIIGQEIDKTDVVSETRVMGGAGTRADLPTAKHTTKKVKSSKAGTKIYTAGVAAKAQQINLNVNEAAGVLIESAGKQMVGIF